MNKEKVLQLISEAMDKGASINVHVGQFNQGQEWPWDKHTKEDAEEFITRFQKAIGGGEIEHNSNKYCDGLTVFTDKIRGTFSYYPYMVEDVKFEEEGESNVG
jgi:hypothetical protein